MTNFSSPDNSIVPQPDSQRQESEPQPPSLESTTQENAATSSALVIPPTNSPKVIRLIDYAPPPYLIPETNLHVELNDAATFVRAVLQIERACTTPASMPLELDGQDLKLKKISINGRELSPSEYALTPEKLIIASVPEKFFLEIESENSPATNKSGQGIYKSDGNFITQMEAEGFRRLTYYVDRPDLLSKYTATVVADKITCPILLSNGDEVDRGELPDGRHFATFVDPFPKPGYLFALVAGDYGMVEDKHITNSGREVTLRLYADKGKEDSCKFALQSLKDFLRWDEEVFGHEYKLDTYNIVAATTFNAGAMENKGLNIFLAGRVLADVQSTTDATFRDVKRVVGHEGSHDFTGNEVPNRDWFQLCQKEGLTSFREDLFAEETGEATLERIAEVEDLRTRQFAEDASPTAHPVRPDSFIEIDNFYTATTYTKGAELYRMVYTLLGRDTFVEGMKKYSELFTGKAVIVEDFMHAMELASGKDLSQFMRWFTQVGTPTLKIRDKYDPASKTYELEVEQVMPVTPNGNSKLPYQMPLSMGLLAMRGQELPLKLEGESSSTTINSRVLELTQLRQTFRFVDVTEKPIPSLLRNFSAPVKIDYPYSREDLELLMVHDSNEFNRFEACRKILVEGIKDIAQNGAVQNSTVIDAMLKVLRDPRLPNGLKAEMLTIPSIAAFIDELPSFDPDLAHHSHDALVHEFAKKNLVELRQLYTELHSAENGELGPQAAGSRALKNLLLNYLTSVGGQNEIALAGSQYAAAKTMTDSDGALRALRNVEAPEHDAALSDFYKRWKDDPRVLAAWFEVQAASTKDNTLQRIKELESDPAYDRHNPRAIRALYATLISNYPLLHDPSGQGYRLLADTIIEVDGFNPNVAASLAKGFRDYQKLDSARQSLLGAELKRILNKPDLSNGTLEIISKIMAK